MGFLKSLDPKLVSALVTAALVRLGLELGVAEDDPLLQSFIALAAAAVAGYFTPNDGTLLREGVLDDGNPDPERLP